MGEIVIIVDDDDNLICCKERDTLVQEDIYRVSALFIKNSRREILFVRRAYTKKKDPGMWGPAVAGTVEEGESYEINIIKEAKEELGLENIKLQKGPKKRSKVPHNHFTQWFFLKIDKSAEDFKINEQEIAEVRWFSDDEVLGLIKKDSSEVITSLKRDFEMLSKYYDQIFKPNDL